MQLRQNPQVKYSSSLQYNIKIAAFYNSVESPRHQPAVLPPCRCSGELSNHGGTFTGAKAAVCPVVEKSTVRSHPHNIIKRQDDIKHEAQSVLKTGQMELEL